jgi:hypothetical protein
MLGHRKKLPPGKSPNSSPVVVPALRYRPQSSSASRFTAAQAGFFDLSNQASGPNGKAGLFACSRCLRARVCKHVHWRYIAEIQKAYTDLTVQQTCAIARDYGRVSQLTFLIVRLTRAKHDFKRPGRWCLAGDGRVS